MGLGKFFTRQAPADQHNRSIVGVGMRIGPSSVLGDTSGTGWWPGNFEYRGALGIPGVERAVSIISDLIGGMPWDAYTQHGRDYAEKISPRPTILEEPNPEETGMETFAAWVMDYLFDGNAIGIIAERNRSGVPTAIMPVPVSRVGIRRVPPDEYSPLPVGTIEYSIGSKRYSANEIFHVKGKCPPGCLRGWGVLEMHLNGCGELDLAAELARQARSISQNGVPTGKIKVTNPDATENDMIAVRDKWMENMRTRSPAVLNATTDFEPLSWNPEEMQLVDARKMSLLEVANIFGLPPRFLGAPSGESMTYSNSETEAIDLMKFSIGGHVKRFEQRLSRLFVRGTWVLGNLDAILRADTLARYQAHQIGVNGGWLLKSEVRDIEKLPPVQGIDEPQQQPPQPIQVSAHRIPPVDALPAGANNEKGQAQ
jgi:HK97 family phage portal protein